jgi:putative PIN family toxin of toxin-antitoxin system
MPDGKLRVVFDCNVFTQALLNPKSTAPKCLSLVREDRVNLFISNATLDEVRGAISRPHILAFLPDAKEEQIEVFIEDIVSISTLLKSVPKKFRFERDPKDEIIIDLAAFCDADYIVTRDKDLLDLMTGYTDECKQFGQRFRPLKVVESIEF